MWAGQRDQCLFLRAYFMAKVDGSRIGNTALIESAITKAFTADGVIIEETTVNQAWKIQVSRKNVDKDSISTPTIDNAVGGPLKSVFT